MTLNNFRLLKKRSLVTDCPARFERATYALEAVKMSRNNKLDNGFNLLTFGVQSAPRTLVLGGM
jgi:hypothetical protein